MNTMNRMLMVLSAALMTGVCLSGEKEVTPADRGTAEQRKLVMPVECEVFFPDGERSPLEVAVKWITARSRPSYVLGANKHCTVVVWQKEALKNRQQICQALNLKAVDEEVIRDLTDKFRKTRESNKPDAGDGK